MIADGDDLQLFDEGDITREPKALPDEMETLGFIRVVPARAHGLTSS